MNELHWPVDDDPLDKVEPWMTRIHGVGRSRHGWVSGLCLRTEMGVHTKSTR